MNWIRSSNESSDASANAGSNASVNASLNVIKSDYCHHDGFCFNAKFVQYEEGIEIYFVVSINHNT